jgi:hypothetical protein
MTSRMLMPGVSVVLGAIVLAVVAPTVFLVMAGLGAAVAFFAWFGRCHHTGGLGLLPPVTDADGSRQPARWYCDSCGRSWPADLEHERRPIVRYSGYDETKLPAAARRAAVAERQRQTLAVQRAGIAGRRADRAPAAPASAANVTSISRRRAG